MNVLIYAACGILGVLFHCLFKANSLKKQATVGNINFSFKTYLHEDYLAILASFVSVGIWLLLFSEAAERYPAIVGFARASFVGMGASGSYLIQYFLSTAEKKIKVIIDNKTNIADNVTGNNTKDDLPKSPKNTQ